MADFTALKTAIQNAIKQNGNEEITGNLLQDVLLAIVTTLGDGSINNLISALNTESNARQLGDSTLQSNINSVTSAITAINYAIANGCVYAGIATPTGTPATGRVFYLALTAGTYTNYGNKVVTQGINILKYNGSTWSLDVIASIDDAPTPSSNNLIKSGGAFDFVMKNGSAFDLTAYNNGTTYADLSAALTALNALPAAYKKGGMSLKFVLTSDNNYVQYICNADSFTTDITKWAICNDEVYMQTSDWVYVIRDNDGHILAGIQYNGEIEWALGIPTPVKEYVDNAISQIKNGNSGTSIDGLNKIVAFLTGFSTSDTLQALLNTKKDKNDPLFTIVNSQDIPDLSQVTLDKKGGIIESTDIDGNFEHYTKHNFKQIGFNNLEGNAISVITDIVEDIVSPDSSEVELTLENGLFDGGGGDVEGTKYIRCQKIQCDGKSIVIAVCPESMSILCNLETDEVSRKNTSYTINAGISVRCPIGFIRFCFRRKDGTDLNIGNLTEAERNGIHVYMLTGKKEGEISLAAYNSPDSSKEKADIVCTDTNAQFILNACLSCLGPLNIRLYKGTYNLYKVFTDRFGKKCALKTQDVLYGIPCTIELNGESYRDSIINMTEDCYDLYDVNNEGSVVYVPCRNEDGVSIYPLSNTYIEIKNLTIKGYDYTKPIVGLNLTFSQVTKLDTVVYRANGYNTEGGMPAFRTMPHTGTVGIRVGYGSNNGAGNYVKHCVVFYCYKGISCAGEHYVFEDDLTHHCYIGWAFGDYHTTGAFEHPNVMIGCSIEGCYRLMYLTKGGITTEGEFVEDGANNIVHSTLICIGLSTEEAWSIPLDEVVEGEPTWQITLPILEVLKGAYRGRIELDTVTSVFENGSGRAFIWTKYNQGSIILGHGNTVDNIYQ